MMLQMLAVFAEFEHATIVDRISAGIERRAKEGRWFGGRPPFGYTFSSEERVLVPDPVKAPVVQRVFDLYARKRLGTRTAGPRSCRPTGSSHRRFAQCPKKWAQLGSNQ
jgi:site-specific DNA recombinase